MSADFEKHEVTHAGAKRRMGRLKRVLRVVGIIIAALIVAGGATLAVAARRSIIPDNINMSSSDMAGMDMSGMQMSAMVTGTPGAAATSMSELVAPQSDAPVKAFTLTAQTARIDLGNGKTVEAYTFNGTAPGPELRVQQGDMVVVTLINKLPVSTTIHWHGISVPNAEDGVAGLTQDAVKPGASYTYRFVASEPGTYWYHTHQETSVQLPLGLYGAIVIEPKAATTHYDRDYTVILHEWGTPTHEGLQGAFICHATCPETLTVDDKTGVLPLAAKAGERVRLRVVNSGDDTHLPALVGAPFEVIALDGHDLNGPTSLNNVAVPIAAAQRFDVSFVMPASGPVALIDANPRAEPQGQHPMALLGDGQGTVSYPANPSQFDFTTYGTPVPDKITPDSHFTAQYDMLLSEKPGFYNGNFTMAFTINGQSYPNIPSINVKLGDLVKIHMAITDGIPFPHSMHLHGHYFTVLAHNGKPLTGSPVHLDTILINPGESYDVAFLADNPGLWMLHCHMTEHDAHGMDMMVVYPNISTPYTIGTSSGNNPF